jgi:hypothetical protein
MLDNLRIHRKFIAILLLPLVLLAALAAAGSAPTSRRACGQGG